MQRIAQMWKWIRLVVILTAGASAALWFTEDHALSTGGITGFGFLFLGWTLLYLAAQRVMVRLYCPFRKVQSLAMTILGLSTLYPTLIMAGEASFDQWKHMGSVLFTAYQHPPLSFAILLVATLLWWALMVYFQVNPTLGQEGLSWENEAN